MSNDEILVAFRGEKLYGDDFSSDNIVKWFQDEAEGYSSLDHIDSKNDVYLYRGLDAKYYWQHLPYSKLDVLGLGSAWGSEFEPISDEIKSLTIVEPATKFWRANVAGVAVNWLTPVYTGKLSLPAENFDLIIIFGVLHHIPNVSSVLSEMSRVLRPGGKIFIREPITSMGDWRYPRRGLTKHERGLPSHFISDISGRLGLCVDIERFIGFSPLLVLVSWFCGAPWNSNLFLFIDNILSYLTRWNITYHRTAFFSKFAPTIGCWVISKPNIKNE